jgi:hypothetical protein
LSEDDLDDGELREKDPQKHAQLGIGSHRVGMVDPELGDGRDENEDAEKELFGRLFLLPRENQPS